MFCSSEQTGRFSYFAVAPYIFYKDSTHCCALQMLFSLSRMQNQIIFIDFFQVANRFMHGFSNMKRAAGEGGSFFSHPQIIHTSKLLLRTKFARQASLSRSWFLFLFLNNSTSDIQCNIWFWVQIISISDRYLVKKKKNMNKTDLRKNKNNNCDIVKIGHLDFSSKLWIHMWTEERNEWLLLLIFGQWNLQIFWLGSYVKSGFFFWNFCGFENHFWICFRFGKFTCQSVFYF